MDICRWLLPEKGANYVMKRYLYLVAGNVARITMGDRSLAAFVKGLDVSVV